MTNDLIGVLVVDVDHIEAASIKNLESKFHSRSSRLAPGHQVELTSSVRKMLIDPGVGESGLVVLAGQTWTRQARANIQPHCLLLRLHQLANAPSGAEANFRGARWVIGPGEGRPDPFALELEQCQ